LICVLKPSLETGVELPKTQTEINNQFTLLTITRYLKKKHGYISSHSGLQSLPSPYKQHLKRLSQLAFVFLGKDKIVFSDNDVETDCPQCVGKWQGLGLLKTVKYSNPNDDSCTNSYNFLHFSIQEFLAAYYITLLDDKKQISVLKKCFWDAHYLTTGIIYTGLTKGNSFALQYFLSGNKSILASKLKGTNATIKQKTLCDKIKCLHLFQCFIEAGNDELVQQVGKYLLDNAIDLSNHALLQNDIYAFSFFLTRYANKTWNVLDLSKCHIRDQGLEIVSRVFSNCDRSKIEIKAVNLSANFLTSCSVKVIVNVVYSCKVQNLILCDNDINYEIFDDILFAISCNDNRPIKVHIEKTEGYISSFYINCKLNRMEMSNWRGSMKCSSNIYVWKTNLKASKITELCCPKVIACVQCSGNALNKASILKQSSNTSVNHAEYILETKNNLIAFNSDAKKIYHAVGGDFLMEDSNTVGINEGLIYWKTVDLYHCSIGDDDFGKLVNYLTNLKQEAHLYFDTFNISNCNLSILSVNTILEFLKNCIVKNLIICNNFIDNESLISLLSDEICANSKVHNFVNKVPLLIFNDFNHNTDSLPSYAITKYFVNCEIDDSVQENNFESTIVSYEVFFTNNGKEENLKAILSLSESVFIGINIVEMNISDKFIDEVLTNLQKKPRNHFSYILQSRTRFVAYGVKQRQITECLDSISLITTLELVKCELEISDFHALKRLCSRSSKQWDIINLSGCSIRDDGFEVLCSQIMSQKTEVYINSLNVSCNRLTSRSVPLLLQLLKHCVINNLIIFQNEISDHDFSQLLAVKYHSGDRFYNFIYEIPLLVIFTVQNTDVKVLNAFFMRHTCNSNTLQSIVVQNGKQSIKVFLVDEIVRQIYMTIVYSKNSILKVNVTKECDLETDIPILIAAFKLKSAIHSIDISKCNIGNNACGKLLNVIFTDNKLWYIKELNLSGNYLTLSCLDDIIQILRCCVIEHLILCENNIPDSKCKDIFFEKCLVNCIILNVVVGSPLVIINDSQLTVMPKSAKYSVTIIMANFHVDQYFTDLLDGLCEYHVDDYVIFLTQTKIMVDDIKKSLSLVCSIITSNTKVCIYEDNLTNEMVEKIVEHLPKEPFIKFILVSQTKFIAYNYGQQLITALKQLINHPSLTSLQVTNCELNPDHLQVIFSPSSYWWEVNFIDLSNCHIGDKTFALLTSYLPFKTHTRHIRILNISDNHLTSSILAITNIQKSTTYHNIIISLKPIDAAK